MEGQWRQRMADTRTNALVAAGPSGQRRLIESPEVLYVLFWDQQRWPTSRRFPFIPY